MAARLIVILVALLLDTLAFAAERRVALVIGNSEYLHCDRLASPVRDARGMRDALGKLGFEVEYHENLGRAALQRAMDRFAETAADADVTFAFYSGHGATIGGRPYLVPVDARYSTLDEAPDELVPADNLMSAAHPGKAKAIVAFDAARDDSALRRLQQTSAAGAEIAPGLAPTSPQDGLIALYSTQYPATSADSEGASAFAAALLKDIAIAGLDADAISEKVARDVSSNTMGRQKPFVSASLASELFLVSPPQASASLPAPSPSSAIKNNPDATQLRREPASPAASPLVTLATRAMPAPGIADRAPPAALTPQRKLAFVVGIDDYPTLPAGSQLERAGADAATVRRVLTGIGFKVFPEEPPPPRLGHKEFLRALLDFYSEIGEGDTVVFYFAGHGVARQGVNYLVPSDVDTIDRDADEAAIADHLARTALPENEIIRQIQDRKPKIGLLVFDACRDDPWTSGKRGLGRSRPSMDTRQDADGLMVIYSTGFDQQALDRLPGNDPDPNSVFTRVFAREVVKPNVSLHDLGENVKNGVYDLVNGSGFDQRPAVYDEIIHSDKYFLASLPEPVQPAPEKPIRPTPAPLTTTVRPPLADCRFLVDPPALDGDGIGHFAVSDSCGGLDRLTARYKNWMFVLNAGDPSRAEFSFDFFAGPDTVEFAAADGASWTYTPTRNWDQHGLAKRVVLWKAPEVLTLLSDLGQSLEPQRGPSQAEGGYVSEVLNGPGSGWRALVYTFRYQLGMRSARLDFRVNRARCDGATGSISYTILDFENGKQTGKSQRELTATQCGPASGADLDRKAPRARELALRIPF